MNLLKKVIMCLIKQTRGTVSVIANEMFFWIVLIRSVGYLFSWLLFGFGLVIFQLPWDLLITFLIYYFRYTPKQILKYFIHHDLGPGNYAAVSYYHGYLDKICTVSEAVHQPELAQRMLDYEDKERITFPFKKLFLLIPKSGRTEPIIGKGSELIRSYKSLAPLELNRAGVKGRTFINSVYKIYMDTDKSEFVYIVAEYVSPLLTIKEICKSLPEYFKFLEESILETFNNSLVKKLGQNPQCGKYCEVIYYDDDKVDSVTALQTRLKELQTDDKLLWPVPEKSHSNEFKSLYDSDLMSR